MKSLSKSEIVNEIKDKLRVESRASFDSKDNGVKLCNTLNVIITHCYGCTMLVDLIPLPQ